MAINLANGFTTFESMPSYIFSPSSEEFTIEFWGILPSDAHSLFDSGASQGTGYRGVYIFNNSRNNYVQISVRKNSGARSCYFTIPGGEVAHYAFVAKLSASTIELFSYLNGEPVGKTNSYASVTNSTVSSFGYFGKSVSGSNYANGAKIQEFRIWNHARTEEQIRQFMHMSPDGEPGLDVYYKMDENSGLVVNDVSLNGHHALASTESLWEENLVEIFPKDTLRTASFNIPFDLAATATTDLVRVDTLPATDIGSRSMTLNGDLKGFVNYAGAECSFQYYPVDQYQNKALNFNGGGHIRIPYESCLSPETITIEAFIKPSQLSGPQTILSQGYQEFNLNDYNTIIYVDAEKGNDLTGNGTQKFPFQTLTEAIKHHNGPTAFIMGKGVYNSVNLNSAAYQEKLAFIGQGRDTTFKIKGTLTASSIGDVKLTADLYFYNLVWDGNNLGGTNYMHLGNYSSWRFYNVVFTNIKDCNYGYFLINKPGLVLSFENCIKTASSKDFLRHSEDADVPGTIKNCYGAWSDWGLNTTESDFIITTTIRTNTPQLDENYNILEDGWQNAGTGTNPDGTRAHIGVYGGPYAWSYLILSYFLKLADSRVEFGCTTDSASRLFSQHEISEGETVHIACTYDKTKMKIYINGNLDSFMPKNENLLAFSVPLYIAKNFNGTIDEIRIWNHARTQKEIEEGITQELTGAEEGLIAYYRFNEGEGDTLHDCSANYNDGTIDNALWVDSPFKLMPPKEKLERIKGLSFDGIDDYVQIPKEALVFNNSPRTYSIYFKADKTLQTSMHILAYGEGDIGKAFGLQLAATGILYLNLYGGGNNIQLFQTNWEGWVDLVYDGTTLKVYYNGEKTFGQNININTGLSEYGHLGHRFYHDPHWYKGIISEFRSFNYALSEVELAAYRYRQLSGNERGLLGYYKMSEEQDNVLIDYSDNNNHGTIYGATWKDEELKVLAPSSLQETPPQKIYSPYTLVKTVTPKEVNGLYFDGVNDYVSIPHNAIIKPQHITIMAWVDRDDWSKVDTNDARIISCTESGGYAISVHSDGRIRFALYIGGGYRYAYSSGPISPGLHFICATYDGKSLKLYIDGELDSEIPYSGNISYSVNNHVTIGVESGGTAGVESGFYLSGVISNLSIWNRGLSEEEVSYYYNNELKGNEHGLVAYYKMDEGEGNKIYNSSLYKDEYNLDGTISGATWDIVSLPETKYKYEPGVKFSSIITPGEYKPISGVIKGLRFDGVDDYVLFGNDSIFRSNLTSITIEAIIKPEKVSGTSFIFDVGFYGDKGYGLSITDSWLIFRTPTAYGGVSLRSTTNINTGSIYYVTCVLDGESDLMKIYINGVLEGQVAVSPSLVLNSTTVTTDDGATKARIGSQAKASYRSERFFKGELYQFRFWNRALSDEEIALYYNKRITQDFPGLVINYSFDKDVGGNVLVDSSPSYNHGAIYGAQRIDADVPLYSIDREPSGTRYYYRAVAKGLPDYALVFNGTSSYATTGIDTLALQDLFDISIDFIAYDFNSLDSIGNRLITALRQNGAYTRWAIGAQDGKIAFWCRLASLENLQQTGSVLQKNTLYNVRVVYDGSLTKIYLNGVLDIEINGRIVSDSYGKIALGILPYGTGELKRCWFGEIRKVSFWNRIRIDDEVAINNSIIVGNEPGLVAYYRMVEGEGDTLVDHSINQSHGTIYGATWEQL